MLLITNFLVIVYLIILFRKKYPVSLSMYWTVVFYAVYIFVPMIRSHVAYFENMPNELVERIGFYSLIGISSFIATNQFFLLRWSRTRKIEINNYRKISHKVTKNVTFFFSLVYILLLISTIGTGGMAKIFSTGSVNMLAEDKNVLDTFTGIISFYLTILGSILILTAENTKQKQKSFVIFMFIIGVTLVLGYARRVIVYPMFAVMFYLLSRTKKKVKILIAPLVVIPVLFIAMFLMGYVRTFGIKNTNIQVIKEYFLYGNFMDIFLANTDFSASYYYLSEQITYGGITANPLGYLKVFFTPIPRFIWENKPQYTSVSILSTLEPIKVSQGFSAATGYIGEALATMGIFGIILVSAIWGIVCGYLDKKYVDIIDRNASVDKHGKTHKKFTIFEYIYLYTGALLITESHRGDFGAASINFVLQVVFLGLILVFFQEKLKIKT